MLVEYEWHSKKNQANIEKHGIDFELVEQLDWSTAIKVQDMREKREVRMIALGLIGQRLHAIVYTMRGGNCRVISLRKANDREVAKYEEA